VLAKGKTYSNQTVAEYRSFELRYITVACFQADCCLIKLYLMFSKEFTLLDHLVIFIFCVTDGDTHDKLKVISSSKVTTKNGPNITVTSELLQLCSTTQM